MWKWLDALKRKLNSSEKKNYFLGFEHEELNISIWKMELQHQKNVIKVGFWVEKANPTNSDIVYGGNSHFFRGTFLPDGKGGFGIEQLELPGGAKYEPFKPPFKDKNMLLVLNRFMEGFEIKIKF
jgi:hypothetical protein